MRLTDFFIAYQRYRRIIKYIFLQKKKTEKYNRNQEIWIHGYMYVEVSWIFEYVYLNKHYKVHVAAEF